jgi:hypothetical protein
MNKFEAGKNIASFDEERSKGESKDTPKPPGCGYRFHERSGPKASFQFTIRMDD